MLAIGLSSSSRAISVPAVVVYSNDLPPRLSRCCVTTVCAAGRRIHCSFLSPLMSMRHSCESCAAEGPDLPPACADGATPSAGAGSCAYATPTHPHTTVTAANSQCDILSPVLCQAHPHLADGRALIPRPCSPPL